MSARTSNSSIFFGDDSTPENKPRRPDVKLSTRVAQPGGTGGKSTAFDPPAELPPPPQVKEAEDADTPVRLSTRIIQPGGTGGRSTVFEEEAAEEPMPEKVEKIEKEEQKPAKEEPKPKSERSRRDTFNEEDPERYARPGAAQRSGGGPSKVFSSSDSDSQSYTGRKVGAKHNVSQVALGGGYPDSEPPKRAPRRGNIRPDYNQSQIAFGDDTNGEWLPERTGRLNTKVLKAGGTGGTSQIDFKDDIKTKTAGSQIVFGDDTTGVEISNVVTSSRVLRPGGTGGASQISFGTSGEVDTLRTSSRVLRPGGTGGQSQITF